MRHHHILLASASPRRAELLSKLDIEFRVQSSDIEETVPLDLAMHQVAEYLAKQKGMASLRFRKSKEILLAADTVVQFNDQILGKPGNWEEAKEILKTLAGNQHVVITGVFLSNEVKTISFSTSTFVELDEMTNDEIDYYLSTYQPYDKAGSYGIQDWIGWAKIGSINGSYSNIMGLPTHEVYRALSTF